MRPASPRRKLDKSADLSSQRIGSNIDAAVIATMSLEEASSRGGKKKKKKDIDSEKKGGTKESSECKLPT